MMKHDGSSVYELFIPGVEAGSIYKYEVRKKDGSCMLITDPYARAIEDEGNEAVVCGDDDFVMINGWHCVRWKIHEERLHQFTRQLFRKIHAAMWRMRGIRMLNLCRLWKEHIAVMPSRRRLADAMN